MADDLTIPSISDAMREWLRGYLDGSQNGKRFSVNSVWTRRSGNSHRGLATCRKRGLITSHADDHISAGGYRHDLTPAGRAAVDALQVDVDRRRTEWARAERDSAYRQFSGLTEPWYGSGDVECAALSTATQEAGQ